MTVRAQSIGVAVSAFGLGYVIRSIVAGDYWLAPLALAIAVVLTIVVVRTGTTPPGR